MKVVFVGTPDFAVESLKAIVEDGHEIVGVITSPDKPKGRGMKMAMSEVKEYALEKGFKIFQPEKIRKNEEFLNEIKELNADIACVVVYGKILPKSFLDVFPNGVLNVHPSLLPKYRGPAPIQWAIINGDDKTGVCTMYLDVGMDDGDIILKEETPIGEDENAGDLWDRLSKMGARMLATTLDNISKGIIIRTPQEGEPVIIPKIEKEMSKIDWNKSARDIKNLVRGLTPGMGTYSYVDGKKLKFWKVDVVYDVPEGEPGEVILSDEKQGLYIKTNDGAISVLEIQGENSKKMSIYDFLRGNRIELHSKFD